MRGQKIAKCDDVVLHPLVIEGQMPWRLCIPKSSACPHEFILSPVSAVVQGIIVSFFPHIARYHPNVNFTN